jgi:argininosuccinate lyase
MKLWGGRFEGGISKKMDQFNASLPFDINLMEYDIEGSLAHVKMLGRQEIISQAEVKEITAGLKEVRDDLRKEIKNNKFDVSEAEDIHTLVE